jgi:4'-phosphopantetheinyl transferase
MRVVIHPCPVTYPAGPPAADEVRVWVVALDRPPCDPAELAAVLTPDERDRAGRYRAGAVRQQFLVGRGLLRRLLGGALGVPPHAVPITYTAAGKPVLADESLHFNLTHTSGLALIAVAPRRVGIDVERVRLVPDADGLVERFFSPAERAAYRELTPERRPAAFLRGWVCKEAVIKAAGASVQYLDRFDVELDPARPPGVLAAEADPFGGSGWSVADWEPAPGFAAAVAVEAAGPLRISRGTNE